MMVRTRQVVLIVALLLLLSSAKDGTIVRLTSNTGANLYPTINIDHVKHKRTIAWFTDWDDTFNVYVKDYRSRKWRTHRVTGGGSACGLGPRHAVDHHKWAIHVAWYQSQNEGYDVFHGRSTDGGKSWAVTRVTDGPEIDVNPATFVRSNSDVHMTWERGPEGARDIMVASSWDKGRTWTQGPVSTVVSDDSRPVVAVTSNGFIHVAWQRHEGIDVDILHAVSKDNGKNWNLHNITADTLRQTNPDIAVRGNDVYVAWEGMDPECNATYCPITVNIARSSNDGATWEMSAVAGMELYRPSIVTSGNERVLLAAEHRTSTSSEVVYGFSKNRGRTWDVRQVSDAEGEDSNPSIAVTYRGKVHLVWQGTSRGHSEIYHVEFWPKAGPLEIATPTPDPKDMVEPTPLPLPNVTILPEGEPEGTPPAATTIPDPSPEPDPDDDPEDDPNPFPDPSPGATPDPNPTPVPTPLPTLVPTIIPTLVPTTVPTVVPTTLPDGDVTLVPTTIPTQVPTTVATTVPTIAPTAVPTDVPDDGPEPSPGGTGDGPASTPGPRPTLDESAFDQEGAPASVPSDPLAAAISDMAKEAGCAVVCAGMPVECNDNCADLLELERLLTSPVFQDKLLVLMALKGERPPDLEGLVQAAWRSLGDGDLASARDTIGRIRDEVDLVRNDDTGVVTLTHHEFVPQQEAEAVAIPAVMALFDLTSLFGGDVDELAEDALETSKNIRTVMDVSVTGQVVQVDTEGSEVTDGEAATATMVKLTVENTKEEDQEDFCIVQVIPKTFAESVKGLTFKQDVKVVVEDPVVLWSVDRLKGKKKVDLAFSVKKQVDNAAMSDMKITFVKLPGWRCKELDPRPEVRIGGLGGTGSAINWLSIFVGVVVLVVIAGSVAIARSSRGEAKTVPGAETTTDRTTYQHTAGYYPASAPGQNSAAGRTQYYHAPEWRGSQEGQGPRQKGG